MYVKKEKQPIDANPSNPMTHSDNAPKLDNLHKSMLLIIRNHNRTIVNLREKIEELQSEMKINTSLSSSLQGKSRPKIWEFLPKISVPSIPNEAIPNAGRKTYNQFGLFDKEERKIGEFEWRCRIYEVSARKTY